MKYIVTLLLTAFLFAQEEAWETELAPVPSYARNHPVNFSLDGKGYLLTGFASALQNDISAIPVLNDFYKYDPITDNWSQLPDFSGSARGFSYGESYNGKAYVGFGLGVLGPGYDYLNDLWEYDPETEEWTELAPCPCAGRSHPAFTITENGKLFVGMGDNNISGNLNDWWEYDIETDTWRELEDLPGFPRHHPYYFSIGNTAYVGLGHGSIIDSRGYFIYNSWYKWETETEEWTQLQDVPFGGRVAGTQFVHNGKGYVLSGQDNNHQNFTEGFFHEYDPKTDTWKDMPSHPGESRWAPGNFVIDSWVYLMGGQYQLDFDPGEGEDQSTMMRFPLEINSSVELETENVIYPNPVYTNLNIDLDENLDKVKVYNSKGKEVFMTEVNTKQINLDNLNSGGYIIEINTPNKKYINKFVKSEK